MAYVQKPRRYKKGFTGCKVEKKEPTPTGLGITSKAIINGDITQIDLPVSQISGLLKADKVLGKIKGIDF